ncbi:MAG: hypothetical protein CL508_05195 [Actinobacteria bacterium]|nr:hypothetical protein [Actinomycetota bacterium]|tara:strand:- start:19827 stop:20027 length:201 start_codon:yes stop_codon:yes gene_type:complete
MPGKIKSKPNIFSTPKNLKSWAIDLTEACGSELINKKHNVSKIDALIEKFVFDYNENMKLVAGEEE